MPNLDLEELRRLLNFALGNAEHVAAGKDAGYPGRTVSFLRDALALLKAPKYATTTAEWEARLNAKFLEGVHDILVWSGCYTGDCPHHDQKECDAHVLEVGQQVAAEFLQDAAPAPIEPVRSAPNSAEIAADSGNLARNDIVLRDPIRTPGGTP